MRGTNFVFAAYHGAMEFILLFVLFAAKSDPALSEKLRSFLAFYRENRDLFAMMTASGLPMSEKEPAKEPEETPVKEERRPTGGADAEKILEEYLRRLS